MDVDQQARTGQPRSWPGPPAAAPGRRRVANRGTAVLLVLAAGAIGVTPAVVSAAGPRLVKSTPVADSVDNGQPGSGSDPAGIDSAGQSTSTPTAQSASTTGQSAASASQAKGVVLIDTTLPGGAGAGTGMVLTSDGQVLTSYHVVAGSTRIRVIVASTGKAYTASLVGHDESRDVALLKLAGASGLATVTLDADGVNVGTRVTAVGNAGGQGYLSQVSGIVTALDQAITAGSEDGSSSPQHLTGLIQTTADVVAGDSGGPMFDAQGEVVGINTAASAWAGTGRAPAQSFAVPIGDAMAVVSQVRAGAESGSVQIGPSAFLGISMASTWNRVDSVDSPPTAGVPVAAVLDGGAASRAGLTSGSQITSIAGVDVTTPAALAEAIAKHQPGDRVRLAWTDENGTSHAVEVTLGAAPVN